jgi:type IV secretory pathway VirB2 component (pilin)
MIRSHIALLSVAAVVISVLLVPEPGQASLVSSLDHLKSQLTGVILPLLAVFGMGFAGVSFYTGNPNAKMHAWYAVLGTIIGFGAQSIVDFIGQNVR